jgi:hypothetical protein
MGKLQGTRGANKGALRATTTIGEEAKDDHRSTDKTDSILSSSSLLEEASLGSSHKTDNKSGRLLVSIFRSSEHQIRMYQCEKSNWASSPASIQAETKSKHTRRLLPGDY